MGKGYLKANLYVGDNLMPVENAEVLIEDSSGEIVHRAITDKYGRIGPAELEAPDIGDQYAKYDVTINTGGKYKKVIFHDVEIFDDETTILPVQMHPTIRGYPAQLNTDEYFIPDTRAAACSRCGPDPGNSALPARPPANEVAIPDYITVHLGSPNDDNAPNYKIAFKDYIKNVASREVFPCWTQAALTANILAQTSFALNRMYTLHYRSRFKSFDITNQTAWDQAFDPSKTTFQSMSDIVDSIFVSFIRRQGRREPFLSSYCSGTTAVCDGLFQCESQDLGLAGYSPMDILRNYYPADIRIVNSTNFSGIVGFYPGTPLQLGSSGEDVLRMQVFLNRLSGNWWIDPIPAAEVNGFFGESTRRAVTMFQQNTPVGLKADGVIGQNTWYEITRLFTAATQLAELTSEGIRIGIGDEPPSVTLYPNTDPVTRGQYVVELQFLINYISKFYESISPVIQNGVFREDTKRGVIYFQQQFGLTADGVVGPATWRTLYDVFKSLADDSVMPPVPETPEPPPSPTVPPFPGQLLRVGSRGSDVLLMQNTLNSIARVYPQIPVLVPDGIFGPRTDASVRAFQRLFGLSVDGIIGPITWYKVFDVYGGLTVGMTPEFNGTNLRIGSRGDDVLIMQEYLAEISGVFPSVPRITADGIFGTATDTVVRAFQRLFGLSVDGVIGKNTWEKIVYVYNTMPEVETPAFPGTALRVGSRGNNVTLIQKYLRALSGVYPSIPNLSADGIFGEGTRRSVTAFQQQFGLTPDGVIGVNTWNSIISLYNVMLMEAQSRSAQSENIQFVSEENDLQYRCEDYAQYANDAGSCEMSARDAMDDDWQTDYTMCHNARHLDAPPKAGVSCGYDAAPESGFGYGPMVVSPPYYEQDACELPYANKHAGESREDCAAAKRCDSGRDCTEAKRCDSGRDCGPAKSCDSGHYGRRRDCGECCCPDDYCCCPKCGKRRVRR